MADPTGVLARGGRRWLCFGFFFGILVFVPFLVAEHQNHPEGPPGPAPAAGHPAAATNQSHHKAHQAHPTHQAHPGVEPAKLTITFQPHGNGDLNPEQGGCSCGHLPRCDSVTEYPKAFLATTVLPSCRDFGMSALPVENDKFDPVKAIVCEKQWREYDPPCECSRSASGADPHDKATPDPRLVETNGQGPHAHCRHKAGGQQQGPGAGGRAGGRAGGWGWGCHRHVNNCIDHCNGLHCVTHCKYLRWCGHGLDCRAGPGDNATLCASRRPRPRPRPQCTGQLTCERLCAAALPCPANCTCGHSGAEAADGADAGEDGRRGHPGHPGHRPPGQWGFHCTASKRNATATVPIFARNRCAVEVLNVTAVNPPPRDYQLSPNVTYYNHLKELRVEGVDLRRLEAAGLQGLAHLRLLSLAGNALTELTDSAFSGLSALRHLDLSRNRLRRLSAHCLWPLHELRRLNLSGNHLYGGALPAHMLARNAELEVLDLSDNPVAYLPVSLLMQLPDATSLREFHCRNCGFSRLSDRPSPFQGFPSLRVLDLGGNAFSSMSELVVGVVARLETLRLGHCGIPALGFLTPTVAIYSRAYNVLVGTRKYAHLDSSIVIPTVKRFLAEQSEPRIKGAPWEKNVHEVNHCEESNYTHQPLYRDILDNFTAADYTRDMFNNLTVLDLGHNFLTQVTQAEMWAFARAKELVLSHNYLHALPCAPFYFMNRLEVLRLSSNPWQEVRPDYFIGLKALRVVECRDCLITSFNRLASPLLAHIEELDVGDNLIETIDAAQVTVLKQLQRLKLDGNRLKVVSHCVFVYNQNLKIIKLQGNDVEDTVFRDHIECPHRLQQ